MELVGASKRTVCGITFQGFFAGGAMLVAFWGYLIRDRVWLQVVYGLHGLLLIGHWWSVFRRLLNPLRMFGPRAKPSWAGLMHDSFACAG